MANSSLDKVIQDFNRRFAEPLPEFYKRRIVVWIDKDREFADKLDEITINGVKVVAFTSGVAGIPFYVMTIVLTTDNCKGDADYYLSCESLKNCCH